MLRTLSSAAPAAPAAAARARVREVARAAVFLIITIGLQVSARNENGNWARPAKNKTSSRGVTTHAKDDSMRLNVSKKISLTGTVLALTAPAFAQTAGTLDKVKQSGAITLAY